LRAPARAAFTTTRARVDRDPLATTHTVPHDGSASRSPALADARLVAVGSSNPVKVGAVRAVLAAGAPNVRVESVAVSSGGPDQPWGDDETIRGAVARATAARAALDADFGVGIEGGVVEDAHGVGGALRTCAWAAVVDRAGTHAIGGSLAMPLPPAIAERVRGGMELGHAMDAETGARNVKHGAGAVGVLTAGIVDRQRAYEHLVAYAFARWLTPALWEGAS
jgi:inosine/xanthosine triphosphatase